MNLNEYQKQAIASAIYPEKSTGQLIAVLYCALGLAEEAGETAGKIKKMIRDHEGVMSDEIRHRIMREMGDVLWYLAALSTELGSELSQVAELNLEKLRDRKDRGALRGSGDDR